MELFLLTLLAIGLIMVAMAVGVVLSGRPLRGSCGGAPVLGPDGEPLTCPDCHCSAGVVPDGDNGPAVGARDSLSGTTSR